MDTRRTSIASAVELVLDSRLLPDGDVATLQEGIGQVAASDDLHFLGILSFGIRVVEHVRLLPATLLAHAGRVPAAAVTSASPPSLRPPLRLALSRLTSAPRGACRTIALALAGAVAADRDVEVLVPVLAQARVRVVAVVFGRPAPLVVRLTAETNGRLVTASTTGEVLAHIRSLAVAKELAHVR